MNEKLVELKSVTKSFGKVNALDQVSFHVKTAEVVGLVGDNGAGKSTLIKIISGVHRYDSGELFFKGERVDGWTVAKAREAGIETVFQDKALVEQQRVSRNIFMGREITGFLGFIKLREQREKTSRLMGDIGFTSKLLSPDSIVSTLSGGEREGVAIARALYFDAELIILDEPTTALSLTEAEKVFSFVRTAKEKGCSCIFISHNIYHTYAIADRFVILDRGKVALEVDKNHASVESLRRDLQSIVSIGR